MSIVKSGAPQPTVQNVATGLKVGMPAGTMPLALKQNAAETANPGLAYFETANGDLGSIGANSGALVLGAATGKALALNVNGSTRAMTIASNGVIGIGTANIGAKLEIKGTGTTNASFGLRVTNANGTTALAVRDDGSVGIGTGNMNGAHRLQISSPGTTNATYGLAVFNGNGHNTFAVRDDGGVSIGRLKGVELKHVCIDEATQTGFLADCTSTAEYVPTIDGGHGYPEIADLVSIAPEVANPYGDTHGPFTVRKTTTACDQNLLGFIVDPELGADGKKLNNHYLPLAIIGYFPAKVTMENGPIKRGDPLMSSSKPGYAMKATDACKIIGYALEDAKAEEQI